MKRALIGVAAVAAGLTFAAPASLVFAIPAAADPDTAFTNELNTYGIYGQKDYNAWIGKITCKRIATGVDATAFEAAEFVRNQLEKDTTTEQAWKFLAAGLRTYCPDRLPVLDQARQ
ncbi:DUF732 domain-containing protein [Mycobacterium sp. 4D054]|uniref:DUF732 domain-containing protein n=1 Tax=unclassified Mycobacterium TaxID=2642494 RepID=UPI0021B3B106|nr:DUF732 domain-containing protein [Mycobacterium sp. SMC-8]UXA10840.1 DUF732 domain-containing protein [Mycobacterium sp. SMC-8]